MNIGSLNVNKESTIPDSNEKPIEEPIEEKPFGTPAKVEDEEEKKIDERWKKKMTRAMTISINEDDHPCWE